MMRNLNHQVTNLELKRQLLHTIEIITNFHITQRAMIQSEDLFFEIGNITMPNTLGARKQLREEIVDRGKKWLNNRRDEFCHLISSAPVQQIFKTNIDQQDDQVRALIDVVASVQFGIPPMVVAKAIIILGETWFCDSKGNP